MSLVPAEIDQEKVLVALGLNPRDPNAQAAVLVSSRYDLDPLLKHIELIPGKKGGTVLYVTRDGYLHVAHQSGVFDGMQVLEETETATYVTVKVAVYRKDMRHPFTAKGRFKKGGEHNRDDRDPWDMALTRAERRALKRAFDVAGVPDSDPDEWVEDDSLYNTETGQAAALPELPTPEPRQEFELPPLPEEEPISQGRSDTQPDVNGEVPVDPPSPETFDPLTQAQNRAIFRLLPSPISDEDRHAAVSQLLGRDVASFKELSKDDGIKLISALQDSGR